MKKQWVFIVVVLAASVALAIMLRAWLHPPLKLATAQLLPTPKIMQQDFVLTMDGTKVPLSYLKGHWTLIFFGYSSCPDVCPVELQKLGQLLKHFDNTDNNNRPRVVFVSVDPERDHPEQLKKYASYFHPSLIGVTGSNMELAALANFFGASFNRTATVAGKEYLVEAGADMPEALGDQYMVNHTSRIFILDPQLRYLGSFAPPYETAALIADVEQMLKQ